jgi:hypothetical protein
MDGVWDYGVLARQPDTGAIAFDLAVRREEKGQGGPGREPVLQDKVMWQLSNPCNIQKSMQKTPCVLYDTRHKYFLYSH